MVAQRDCSGANVHAACFLEGAHLSCHTQGINIPCVGVALTELHLIVVFDVSGMCVFGCVMLCN